jgi:hypothetical protein
MREIIEPRNIESVDDEVAAILRAKSPAERIQMAAEANDTARLLAAAGIRYRHPDWSVDQVAKEVARRMLGASS